MLWTPSRLPVSADEFRGVLLEEAQRREQRLRLFDFDPEGSPREPEETAELHRAERIRCAHDVYHWLETYVWLEDPKKGDPRWRIIPLVLWPRQRELVDFLVEGIEDQVDRNVNKARELGVSWLSCAVILHRWLFEKGFRAKLGSRVEKYVDDRTSDSLFGKTRFMLEMQPRFLMPRSHSDTHMRLINEDLGSEITGESTNERFGRGGRRTVILLDESAHVDNRVQNSMQVSLESVAGSLWRNSTPNGRGNRFHTDYVMARTLAEQGDDSAWQNWLELDWRTDPRKTEAWFEGLLREAGGTLTWDEREQEHNTSFAGVSGLRILKADRSAVEYTDEDLPPLARESWFHLAVMDFGSGPSWTVCYWLLLNWDQDDSPLPVIYVDAELVRQRTSAYEIGPQIVEIGQRYTGIGSYTGDPAGRNTESDQESWEARLRSTGVPLSVLDSTYNTHDMILHNLRESQMMLDRSRLRIHADNCPILLEALESWEWDVPVGVPLELVNRETIKPKKDAWSHPGDAVFRYGVGKALRTDPKGQRQMASAIDHLPPQEASSIDQVLDQLAEPGIGW